VQAAKLREGGAAAGGRRVQEGGRDWSVRPIPSHRKSLPASGTRAQAIYLPNVGDVEWYRVIAHRQSSGVMEPAIKHD
jgi:hypothetical protein